MESLFYNNILSNQNLHFTNQFIIRGRKTSNYCFKVSRKR